MKELIARYEAMKAKNKPVYFDSHELSAIADFYAALRHFDTVQEVISYGLNLHPDSSELLVQQAYLFLDTNQFEKAKLVVRSISDPDDYSVKLLKAEILINEKKMEEADRLLSTLEDCAKEDLLVLVEISYLYLELGYSEIAISWLEKGLDTFKEEEDFLSAVADCYCAGGDLTKAVYFYNKAIDKNPYSAPYWTGLAKCHFAGRDYDKALEAADFALAADKTYGEAHLIKAHSLFHLENRDQAIEEYQKALSYKGLSPDLAYLFMGLAHCENEEWDVAVTYFGKSIEYIKKNDKENSQLLIDLYNNQAHCYTQLEKFREAHTCCDAALKIDPENYESLVMKGRIYLDEDEVLNFEKAVQAWDKALISFPEPEAWAEIGDYYFSYGLYAQARLCFEHLLEAESPYNDEVNPKLAFICLTMRDHEGFEKYNSVSKQKINLDELLENALASELIDEESLCEIHSFVEEHHTLTRKMKKRK